MKGRALCNWSLQLRKGIKPCDIKSQPNKRKPLQIVNSASFYFMLTECDLVSQLVSSTEWFSRSPKFIS